MTHVIITVGTSALTNEDIGKGKSGTKNNKALRDKVERFHKAADKSSPVWNAMKRELEDEHREFWQPIPDKLDQKRLKQTSAELASTFVLIHELAKKNGNVPFKEMLAGTNLYLLSSDTDEGSFAAELNLLIMKNQWRAPHVTADRIQGLGAKNASRLDGDLSIWLSAFLMDHEEEHVVFNVTGGFKGAVVPITLAAREFKNAQLLYMHEDSGVGDLVSLQNSATPADASSSQIGGTRILHQPVRT